VILGLPQSDRDRIIGERSSNQLDLDRIREILVVPVFYQDQDCPICMDVLLCPVETNCRHAFCAKCLLLAWKTPEARGSGPTTLSPLSCPMCRQEVSMMVPKFELMPIPENSTTSIPPAGSDQTQPLTFTEEKKYVTEAQAELRAYNRRFSDNRKTIMEYVKDIPLVLNHIWLEVTGQGGLRFFCTAQVIVAIIGAILYLLLPYDIFPEQVFGMVGFLDDLLIMATVLVYLSYLYRAIVIE